MNRKSLQFGLRFYWEETKIKSGDGDKGGGNNSGLDQTEGTSSPQARSSHAPQVNFRNHADEGRVIDLGHSLDVNIQHPDFI